MTEEQRAQQDKQRVSNTNLQNYLTLGSRYVEDGTLPGPSFGMIMAQEILDLRHEVEVLNVRSVQHLILFSDLGELK